VLLPAQSLGEKEGTVTNSERRISRQRTFLPTPGDAKPDWWIVSEVARRMGYAAQFNYRNSADVWREHAALSAFENDDERDFNIGGLAQLDADSYATLAPIQWPVSEASRGTARMFTSGRFYTPSRKAQFIAVGERRPANPVSTEYPLVLNSGRVRDHWHTLTRTGKSPRLSGHIIEPYAEVHPHDAAVACIEDGGLVRVNSAWGEAVVRAHVSETQRKGSVFIPMHWNQQFSSLASVDCLINPATDPVSGQPEFKHTPVAIMPYNAAWYGFILSRRRLTITNASYWASARGEGLWRFEIAGDQSPQDWADYARQLLCSDDSQVDWLEFSDAAASRYRAACVVNNRLDSCIFISPGHELPSRDWLSKLFEQDSLDDSARRSLLTGTPSAGQIDAERIVCACFSVGVNTIMEAIETQQLTSAEQIGELLKAGTNCGSCVPELKALLKEG